MASRFYSTNHKAQPVSFREALLKGQAPDRGLYMPEIIPPITFDEIVSFKDLTYAEIAYNIAGKFLTGEIEPDTLKKICEEAYNFDTPLEQVFERKYILRLDQGPSASFKDYAARMMGRLMQHFTARENHKLLILTATSGDTGSAIANAFYGLDNIRVIVLFPENEVSDRQRKQMTTLHDNIQIISIKGKFDDCQALVKSAFADPELSGLDLSSANSINIGRLIPQSIYYIYAYAKLCTGHKDDQVLFSVPSGNFGDLMGGLLAMKMGLPVKRFIVSTNANNEVPLYLRNGKYKPIVPSLNCISNAMNVGHPSNLARIIALYGGRMDEKGNIIETPDEATMKKELYGIEISDEQTKETIKDAFRNYELLLEPHGAVAWKGLMQYFNEFPNENTPEQLAISLETAHPAKFPTEINHLLNLDPSLPESLKGLEDKEEKYIELDNNYRVFKQYLLNSNR